jgi:hypothetical protein
LDAQATSTPSTNTGSARTMSLRCVPPPVYASLPMKTSPGRELRDRAALEDVRDDAHQRAEMDRDVLGLRDGAAGGVEQRRRAVPTLLDVGRVRRPHQGLAISSTSAEIALPTTSTVIGSTFALAARSRADRW